MLNLVSDDVLPMNGNLGNICYKENIDFHIVTGFFREHAFHISFCRTLELSSDLYGLNQQNRVSSEEVRACLMNEYKTLTFLPHKTQGGQK